MQQNSPNVAFIVQVDGSEQKKKIWIHMKESTALIIKDIENSV